MKMQSVRPYAFLTMSVVLCACGAQDPNSYEEESVGLAENAISGSTNPGPTEVVTCQDNTYGGYCALMTPGFWAATTGVANDSLTSFKVGSGVRATFCSDSNFGGTCGQYYAGARVSFLSNGTAPPNDSASSVRIVLDTTPDCRVSSVSPPTGWVFLYRDSNFAGDCVALQAGDYNGAGNIGLANDTLSSLKIGPGLSAVTVYNNTGFTGVLVTYSTGGALTLVAGMSGSTQDRMSAISIH